MTPLVHFRLHLAHPEGFQTTLRDSLELAFFIFGWLLYPFPVVSDSLITDAIPSKADRNELIYIRYLAGERAAYLAQEFGVSVRRINKLIWRFQRQ